LEADTAETGYRRGLSGEYTIAASAADARSLTTEHIQKLDAQSLSIAPGGG
jgi:hypothetical protein